MNKGKFVISLDFELFWGVRDVRTIRKYGNNILGVYTVIPELLKLFEKYGINATFSVIGLLFFENKQALLAGLPEKIREHQIIDQTETLRWKAGVADNNFGLRPIVNLQSLTV